MEGVSISVNDGDFGWKTVPLSEAATPMVAMKIKDAAIIRIILCFLFIEITYKVTTS